MCVRRETVSSIAFHEKGFKLKLFCVEVRAIGIVLPCRALGGANGPRMYWSSFRSKLAIIMLTDLGYREKDGCFRQSGR